MVLRYIALHKMPVEQVSVSALQDAYYEIKIYFVKRKLLVNIWELIAY